MSMFRFVKQNGAAAVDHQQAEAGLGPKPQRGLPSATDDESGHQGHRIKQSKATDQAKTNSL